MPKKEHEVDEGAIKKVDGDAADGEVEITLEIAQEAPVQTAVYMSRVQRAKMANAQRAKAAS